MNEIFYCFKKGLFGKCKNLYGKKAALGSLSVKKDLSMGYDTLKKYLNSNKPFKGKIFSSIPLNNNDK